MTQQYVATIHTPGCLPFATEVFDHAHEAWAWLTTERERAEWWDDGNEPEYESDTVHELRRCEFFSNVHGEEWAGTISSVWAPTPNGSPTHDLGLYYSVEPYDGDDDGEPEPERVSKSELYERYDDMIDEIDGPVRIGVIEFDPSRVLKELDPIAYRVGFNDWLSNEGIDSDTIDWEE